MLILNISFAVTGIIMIRLIKTVSNSAISLSDIKNGYIQKGHYTYKRTSEKMSEDCYEKIYYNGTEISLKLE